MVMEFTGIKDAKDGMSDILTELEEACEEAGFVPLAVMFCKKEPSPDKTIEIGLWLNQKLDSDPHARFAMISDLKLMLEQIEQKTKQ